MEMPDIGAGVAAGAFIGAEMKSLKKAAADGHFAISETGGEALLQAFREMTQWVDDNRYKLEILARNELPLGSSNGANVMKPFHQQVVSGEQGFITMLLRFRDSLADGEQGVLDAMSNYQNKDHDTAQTFT